VFSRNLGEKNLTLYASVLVFRYLISIFQKIIFFNLQRSVVMDQLISQQFYLH
jgi:hypothetical protein